MCSRAIAVAFASIPRLSLGLWLGVWTGRARRVSARVVRAGLRRRVVRGGGGADGKLRRDGRRFGVGVGGRARSGARRGHGGGRVLRVLLLLLLWCLQHARIALHGGRGHDGAGHEADGEWAREGALQQLLGVAVGPRGESGRRRSLTRRHAARARASPLLFLPGARRSRAQLLDVECWVGRGGRRERNDGDGSCGATSRARARRRGQRCHHFWHSPHQRLDADPWGRTNCYYARRQSHVLVSALLPAPFVVAIIRAVKLKGRSPKSRFAGAETWPPLPASLGLLRADWLLPHRATAHYSIISAHHEIALDAINSAPVHGLIPNTTPCTRQRRFHGSAMLRPCSHLAKHDMRSVLGHGPQVSRLARE